MTERVKESELGRVDVGRWAQYIESLPRVN